MVSNFCDLPELEPFKIQDSDRNLLDVFYYPSSVPGFHSKYFSIRVPKPCKHTIYQVDWNAWWLK